MIFHCYDLANKSLVFKYSSADDKHDCISNREVSFVNNEGCLCGKDRFYIIKHNTETNHIFVICFDDVKTRKEAKFLAKHTIQMFLMANPIIDAKHNAYEEIVKTSVHNTRNLNSQITSKILSHLKEQTLSTTNDKVAYIEKLISKDTKGFAREVLSILKISTQISNEYNVIDYLKPNIKIPKNEFGRNRVHSLLVLTFYQFESDFNSRGIYVEILPTDLSVYINYNTVQTLLTHIFTNSLKYCMPNTKISIKSSMKDQDTVEIRFSMRSLYLTDDIIKNGRINGVRSDQARKIHEKGTGMGLGIIDALCNLNRGSFSYSRTSDSKIESQGYTYSDNCFYVRLLKDEFYE